MTDEIIREENTGFAVTDDRSAEWALGKIKEAKAEQEKWEAFYEKKLEAIRNDTQSTIDFMTHHLRLYFMSQECKVTKSGMKKYSLPSADLIEKPAGIDYERDEAAMLEWCEKHLPEAIKVTRKAGWAEVKAHIKATGEIPDGVTPVETLPTFSIKEV